MEVSILNEQTIQCILTEAEMADYGMDKQALLQNDERTRDFFKRIMRQAEVETGFVKRRGNVAVHASFLSDESLEITFFINTKPKKSLHGKKKPAEDDRAEIAAAGIATAVLKSKDLMSMIAFCQRAYMGQADAGLRTWLYKYKNIYFLLADLQPYDLHKKAVFFNLSDEYMDGVCHTEVIAAFLREHGLCIVSERALEVLGGL